MSEALRYDDRVKVVTTTHRRHGQTGRIYEVGEWSVIVEFPDRQRITFGKSDLAPFESPAYVVG